MDGTRDEFLEQLRSTFRVEAQDHLSSITAGLLALERTADPDAARPIVEAMFRAAHSLKGASRAVDFSDVESLCGSLEDTFARWRTTREFPGREILDTVHRTVDTICAALTPRSPSPQPTAVTQLAQIPAFGARRRDDGPAGAAAADRPPGSHETVRIPVAKLDARVVQAEEMLAAKQIAAKLAGDLRELTTEFGGWKKAWSSVEPHARALRQTIERARDGEQADALLRLLDFLESNADHVKALEGRVTALAACAARDRQAVGTLVDALLEDSKELLLLPFAGLVAPFPKLVRDLCRDQGKDADLVIRGEDVDIDKRILEEMKAPLIHLLRNCVDHGIETPEERRRAGKPARGTIMLSASRVNGHKVEIVVSDDGSGIDPVKVRAAAVAQGTLSADAAAALDDAQATRLAFEPELSTRPVVTSLSGRGLGLAIVREHAERLGGSVTVESEHGRGTRFAVVVPSVLATFRGVLVEAARQVFVIPTLHVERVVHVNAGDIATVEGLETVSIAGRTVSLVRLADLLELPATQESDGFRPDLLAVVLSSGSQRVAAVVEAVLNEQEVLVKQLRKPLVRVRNVAGATVLASGQAAPILNVSDLLRSAKKPGAAIRRPPPEPQSEAETKSILLVEDSITSRMLLKGILESAGYSVVTALDGLDALALLRTQRFDLVVSDVEMPRLNGFDFTARLRADPRFAEIPVVLVTALATQEDRERGIDVGADAYIVKSSFDQSNLLEAVRRLV